MDVIAVELEVAVAPSSLQARSGDWSASIPRAVGTKQFLAQSAPSLRPARALPYHSWNRSSLFASYRCPSGARWRSSCGSAAGAKLDNSISRPAPGSASGPPRGLGWSEKVAHRLAEKCRGVFTRERERLVRPAEWPDSEGMRAGFRVEIPVSTETIHSRRQLFPGHGFRIICHRTQGRARRPLRRDKFAHILAQSENRVTP